MNFERGKDPHVSIGIGLEPKLDKLVEESIERHKFNLCNGSIRSEQRQEIEDKLGIPVGLEIRDGEEGEYYLIVTCQKIGYKKEFEIVGFGWPIFQKVAAQTMAGDLVSVKPMAAPKGELFYLDYKYKRPNIFRRIWNKIFGK